MKRKEEDNLLVRGDVVELDWKSVKWYCENFDHYMVPSSNKIEHEHFLEISFWLKMFIKKRKPIGVVIGYGSTEDYSTRLNVRVRFRHLGKKVVVLFYEKNLKKVKRGKKS